MSERYLSTKQVKEIYDLHRQTLLYWEKKGIIDPPPRTPGGQRRYPESAIKRVLNIDSPQHTAAIYSRVSKRGTEKELRVQQDTLLRFAREEAYRITVEASDMASGLAEGRSGLQKIMERAEQRDFSTLIVESRDRLAIFGYSYLEAFFKSCGVNLVVVDKKREFSLEEVKEELKQAALYLSQGVNDEDKVFIRDGIEELIK